MPRPRNETPPEVLAEVVAAAKRRQDAEDDLATARDDLAAVLADALDGGASPADLGEALGLTRQRVYALAAPAREG